MNSTALFAAINPTTGRVIREYEGHTPTDVQQRLKSASYAYSQWKILSYGERGAYIHRVAQAMRDRRGELARLMTDEMGKPIVAAEAEVDKCAAACDFFAEHAADLLQVQNIASDATRSYVRCEPLGAVLAVMPWNFPLWQVFRFAAPTLMAGNVGLLKHAPNVPGCALAIESLFHDAGVPAGVFTNLFVDISAVPQILADDAVVGASVTGSTRAGAAVAQAAGGAIKKCVLELGGSDAFIVLDDADIPMTARAAAEARCINSGQSCIAAKRFIVEAAVARQFESAFADAMAALRIGDPVHRDTQVGPLARQDLLDTLADQVRRSFADGARLVTGGHRLARPGFFYMPTILADIGPGNAAFDEETFGPVAALTIARDGKDAVRLANASQYGLGASIWTTETRRAETLAQQIQSGNVFINGPVKSGPSLPFGGIKQSGYGRELAEAGIREFVNLKTVWIR